MLKLLSYLVNRKVATSKTLFAPLADGVRGLPMLSGEVCDETELAEIVAGCPTDALRFATNENGRRVLELDRGACIACGFCLDVCPSKAIKNDSESKIARRSRDELISRVELQEPHNGSNGKSDVSKQSTEAAQEKNVPTGTRPSDQHAPAKGLFERSIAIRVVSTGCSACDLEIGAAGNPIFDMERFGMHVVASPRFADVLLVTGPVPKAMHEPLRLCYEAMSEPRLVVAVGTCAISGGLHKDGYTQANGASAIVPVDVFVPGCPPNPWSIIDGIAMAMGRERLSK
jgi:Ni,Fe-hydrogenase III small subunit/formate hydrogenlyase subunit 6/NADH:ubiquinone oxidoreductase subunit I